MQENVRKYLTKLKENRKLRRRNQLVMIAVGLLVVSGVFGMLIMPGLGEETEPVLVCEKAEHTHEDACWGKICELGEHTHSDECKQLGCGKEEHEHSAESCSVTYTCTKEEEGHEHTVDACSFEYTCDKEGHVHADACYTSCSETEHTHSEEAGCYGYTCGQEEHTHTDECYEKAEDITNPAAPLALASEEDTVSEVLVVSVDSSQTKTESGQALTAYVHSQYSGPNNGEDATVWVNISNLPDGVVLTGFIDGERVMKIDENSDRTVTLHLVENEDGTLSVWFNQQLGDTASFELTFETAAGIGNMDEETQITVEIDSDKTTKPDDVEGTVAIKEGKKSVTLTWTAENKWDPVKKAVSATSIAVNAENKFSGVLTYNITANCLNSANNSNYGEIWTDYVTVKDTLTFSDKISLPDEAKIDDGKIATADGEVIISFTELQGGEVTSLRIENNNKSITYELKISNPNKENGKLTAEMAHLALKMEMNTNLLKLEDEFILKDMSVVEAESITNYVEIQPVPIKGNPKDPTNATVVTKSTLDSENFEFTKTADKDSAKAGEEIEYTITLKNIGETPLTVKEGDEYYTVTDTLPEYLELTAEQISAIEEKGATVKTEVTDEETDNEKTSYTISWITSKEKIVKDASVSLSFKATVKSDDTIKELDNGVKIINSASYRAQTAECPVTYKAADITVKKAADVNEVGNGGQIKYTLTVENNTDVAALVDETVKDELPSGLTFVSATIGNTTVTESANDVTLHSASNTTHTEEHKVTFTVNTNKDELLWNIGRLAANEEIELTFLCSVNTDELENGNQIENIAKLSSGSASSCTVGVENPINLDKKVKLASEDESAYTDGISSAYPNGTAFDYKIEVSNDAESPSKKEVTLVDQMPSGMLPVDVTLMVDGMVSDIEWEDFVKLTADDMAGKKYTATVSGYTATVENVDGAVKFTWSLGVIGNTVTITYQAKLVDDTITSGVLNTYTNTVTIGDLSDEVTVKGGDNSGKLVINKQILHNDKSQGNWSFVMKNIGDPDVAAKEQGSFEGYFVITGVDVEGNDIEFEDGSIELKVPLTEFKVTYFTTSSGIQVPQYSYEKTGVPAGTYTIKEVNCDFEDGYSCHPVFDTGSGSAKKIKEIDEFTVEIAVIDNGTSIVDVENFYFAVDTVNLQKNVYEIAKYDKDTNTWQSLADKSQFYIGDDKDTYVVYNVVASVGGAMSYSGHYATVNLSDQLPEELSFVGILYPDTFSNDVASYSVSSFTNITRTREFYINWFSPAESSYTWAKNVVIKADYNEEDNEVFFNLQFPDYVNSKGKVVETYEQNEFPSNNVVSFLMLCKVEGELEEGQDITNTMKLEVEDKVYYTEKDRYTTYRTPYDANQNNGGTELVGGGDGTGSVNTVLTSSVTVTPENTIVPGIEKEAVSYILQGSQTEQELNEESSIVPNSAVKWEITIHNDGTEPMTGYTIEDLVTAPFHFMTKEEASKFGITTPYKYDVYTFDGKYNENDISENVFNTIKDGSTINEYTFDFIGDYSIPAGGYAVLTMYTNNTLGTYKAYKNTATVYADPSDDFSANLVKYGELVKDSNGKYIGVSAADSVYAFGEYATVSWKTIAEKADETNAAKGTDTKNYIFVENNSRDVVYTNNIKNISKNDFTDVVIIDVMPMKNDLGVVNQNEKRGSEFRVLYAGIMVAKVLDSSGNVVRTPDFTLQFSKASSFTENDFAGEETTKWHESWNEDDRSFRVVFNNNFVLKQGETLVIQYEGEVEDAAVPGAIAWNSFGYQYKCGTESLRAEPPKVGVMIPEVPIIQKEVIDSNGDVQEKDATKEFKFILWNKEAYDSNATEAENEVNAKLCEFTIAQGGYIELTDLDYELEEGKEYMITEDTTNMPDGYSFVGIGEYGGELSTSYSFVYDKTKSINILARNQVELYVKELPATGGFSALAYKVTGILLLLSAGLLCSYRLIIRRKKRNLL